MPAIIESHGLLQGRAAKAPMDKLNLASRLSALRERAAQVRRLATGMHNDAMYASMLKYASELDAEADRLQIEFDGLSALPDEQTQAGLKNPSSPAGTSNPA